MSELIRQDEPTKTSSWWVRRGGRGKETDVTKTHIRRNTSRRLSRKTLHLVPQADSQGTISTLSLLLPPSALMQRMTDCHSHLTLISLSMLEQPEHESVIDRYLEDGDHHAFRLLGGLAVFSFCRNFGPQVSVPLNGKAAVSNHTESGDEQQAGRQRDDVRQTKQGAIT
jgi:hypothetical protein